MTDRGNEPVTLVTGGLGCIGAWVLHHLARQGRRAVSFDLSQDRHRLDLLLTGEEQRALAFVTGDLTQIDQILDTVRSHGVTHIIHLAALQVPFCRAKPNLGAQVNVTGTVNVFEAARQCEIRHLAYASSVAVYGPPSVSQAGKVLSEAPLEPVTLYGVTKVANEGTARVYWQEHGISSTALRPYTVYGAGRDQGFTSGPTTAMLAAAAGKSYHIPFNGPCQFHYASDVALQFIAAADRPLDGPYVFNLGGEPALSAQVAALIEQNCPGVKVTWAEDGLPFPAGFDDLALRQAFPQVYQTPLAEGVRETIELFRRRLADRQIQPPA